MAYEQKKADAVKKHKEGQIMVEKFNVWENEANKKVEYAARNLNTTETKIEEYFKSIKRDVDANSTSLMDAVKIAKQAHDEIHEHMARVAKESSDKLKKKVKGDIAVLTKCMDHIESNITTVHNELKSWRDVLNETNTTTNKRLRKIPK